MKKVMPIDDQKKERLFGESHSMPMQWEMLSFEYFEARM
jgi:hypothetical protein